ncbi:hypothetical protein H634G_11210 [Metarhizium anisopliae BRIP 53293]|uniref:Piwi domain-containing protein n=1 Tax=Metarhizium anisopliae BRIP 53293 TaxID=1291518 RepID=A0A0D9NHV6_METAN|nr:hypothetical protein H634G_11210 [Metarhizium anisopliae BRIP 53293]
MRGTKFNNKEQGPRGRGSRGDRGSGSQFSLASRGGQEIGSRGFGGRGRGHGRGRGSLAEVQIFSQGNVAQPDLSVTRSENNVLRSLSDGRGRLAASVEGPFPIRPGFGTRGKSIVLWTNHLQLTFKPDVLLYRYSIEVMSGEGKKPPAGRKAKRIIQIFLTDHFPSQADKVASDFKSNLISIVELDIDKGEYKVQYRAEGEDGAQSNATPYLVRIQYTGALTVCELTRELTSTSLGGLFGSKEEILQALNIVMGYHAKVDGHVASIGTSRHFSLNSDEKISIAGGLQILRGFFCSGRVATSRILLNIQVKHGAFYDDCPLDILATQFMAVNNPSLQKLAAFLTNLSVNATHIVKTNRQGDVIKRIKMITGLATQMDGRDNQHPPRIGGFGAGPKDVEFFLAGSLSPPKRAEGHKKGKKVQVAGPSQRVDGRYVSVYEHFEKTYKIMIRDTTLPVINVGTQKNPSYLPMEVCHVLPGQPARSQLSPNQVQQTIRFAVRKPTFNAQSIATSGLRTLGLSPTCPTLTSFGIQARPELIAVPGRVLPPPVVKYCGGKAADHRFGSWNLWSLQVNSAANLARWTYLSISVRGKDHPWANILELKSLLGRFRDTLRRLGINTGECVQGLDIVVNPHNANAEVDNAIRCFETSKNPPQLLLVILPASDNVALYNRVKFACDVEAGLINVCVVGSRFAKADEQYYANVGLKVNLKLRGQNHYIDGSQLGILGEGKTMLVGIDVTHPSPGSSQNAPSVAGIVASVDKQLAQWPAELRIQAAQQEMVSGLDDLLKSRLVLWRKHNPSYPENILVCRDGVSEGEYGRVLDQEEPQLRNACRDLYPTEDTKRGLPRLTFVIVGKRHNARFYATRQEDADRSGNPKNGTVVDRGITEAGMWECYLQSHAAIQGTARSAHYTVVIDEIFRRRPVVAPFQNTADVVEDLLHKLCYLYGRATKAVSLCAPAYYAQLVCERARCYLSDVYSGRDGSVTPDPKTVRIHAKVRDSMFYI